MSHKLTHGFRAKARLRSVFADSKARVITLARRSKKPRPQQWKNYPSALYRSLREKRAEGFPYIEGFFECRKRAPGILESPDEVCLFHRLADEKRGLGTSLAERRF